MFSAEYGRNRVEPSLRSGAELDLKEMKARVKAFLAELMRYAGDEQLFLDQFIDKGIYQPQHLFKDSGQAKALSDGLDPR